MNRLFALLLSYIYPKRCILCRKIIPETEGALCPHCLENAPYYPYGNGNPSPRAKTKLLFLDSFTAVWYYEGDARQCIIRYKFHRRIAYGKPLGIFLAQQILDQGPENADCLVWVPISQKRLRSRGFDQSQIVAETAAEALDIPAMPALRKIRNTSVQSRLKKATARKANVLGAYQVTLPDYVKGKRIILVDDVFTTGATTEECARMLLTAGAKEVHCAVLCSAMKK